MEQSFYISRKEETFLNLAKPLIFYDLETTGKSPATDRIVEIFAVKIKVDGSRQELHHLLNPTIPISAGATAVHGITDEMVADKPTLGELVQELFAFFDGCDLAGYNIKGFDVPMLMEEFARHKKYLINFNEVKLVDAMGIYHSKEKRDLSAALKFYCERDHTDAHSAKADVMATIEILKQQLLMYEDLEPNTSFLHDYLSAGGAVDGSRKFKRNDEGEIVFNFGKHFGKPACNEPNYLKWMLEEGDFAVDTKMVAKKIYKHCLWQDEIKTWLVGNKVLQNTALASVLYTAAKFEKDVFPFSVNREGDKLIITYLSEPPSQLALVNEDAKKILLNALDNHLGDKVEPISEK